MAARFRDVTTDGPTMDGSATGVDRRTALKKAAIAAGVVAWTTPAVQAVTARPVHAQTVTGCAPALSATAKLTGPGCKCVTGEESQFSQCCDDNTFFFQVRADCGALCGGSNLPVDLVGISGAGPKPGCPLAAFERLDCLGSPPTATVTIEAKVKCADKVWTVTQAVTVACAPCPTATLAATEEDFLPESLDVTEETSPGGESPPLDEPMLPPPEETSPPVSVPAGGGSDNGGSAPP
jgi:hypothetical protein